MTFVALAVVTLVLQRLLGIPGVPPWCGEAVVPMVLLVGSTLSHSEQRTVWGALLLGLAWDVTLEPVVGPGGISWTASALALQGLAAVLADRSPRAWVAGGVVGVVVLVVARELALLPLGLGSWSGWLAVARGALLTGLWCGAVGCVLALDLPARWKRHRARRLR